MNCHIKTALSWALGSGHVYLLRLRVSVVMPWLMRAALYLLMVVAPFGLVREIGVLFGIEPQPAWVLAPFVMAGLLPTHSHPNTTYLPPPRPKN